MEIVLESNTDYTEYSTKYEKRLWIDASDEDSEIPVLPPIYSTTEQEAYSRDDHSAVSNRTNYNSPRLHTHYTPEAVEYKVQLQQPRSSMKRPPNNTDSHVEMDIEDRSVNLKPNINKSGKTSTFKD